MGLFSKFFKKQDNELPAVETIMPLAALTEISCGRLPILKTDTVLLNCGELVHYIDKAILLKHNTIKRYKSNRFGVSFPGLFKGDRVFLGSGESVPIEESSTSLHKGILYITNKRIIFVNKKTPMDKKLEKISALIPYSNGVELQFSDKNIIFILSDGSVAEKVIKLLR